MGRSSIGLRFCLPCFVVTTTRLCTMAFLQIKLSFDERSGWWNMTLNTAPPCKNASVLMDKSKGQKKLSLNSLN